jgi:long-chain acyl-CoA synthetase
MLKRAPLIQEIVLLEDSGSVAALVAPDFAALGIWAKQQGIDHAKQADLAARPETRKEIRSQIEALSGQLAEFERVRKIAVLDHALSVESGEMTPTLKVRRKVVREKYGYMLN